MVKFDDILKAFQFHEIENQESRNEMPWDLLSNAINTGTIPKPIFTRNYASLSPGHWVEDELLEKVVEIVIQQNQLQDKVALLESFVFNWSLQSNQSDVDISQTELAK